MGAAVYYCQSHGFPFFGDSRGATLVGNTCRFYRQSRYRRGRGRNSGKNGGEPRYI
ncbi:hypothetical protein HMPREF9278_0923 [Mobiluncus mulieris FB024-16]|nr:hypothetical protein HMPREF9278_0923 [Mobiluncus mulieris FB024-16]